MQIIERIKKANEVIDYAIKYGVSIKSASVLCGYSDTYVKNVKMKVYEAYLANEIDVSTFTLFESKLNEYYVNKDKKNKTVEVKPPRPQISKPQDQVKFSSNGNEAEVEMNTRSNYTEDHIKTLEQLLEKAKVDMDVWHVKDFLVNKWDVTLKENDVAKTYENFQVKARLERLVEVFRFKQAAEIFKDMIDNYEPPVLVVNHDFDVKTSNENNLLEISIFDLHLGKLAWAGETGENYDTKIARKRFLEAIEMLLNRSGGFDIDRILFPIGNDFFNSDTIFNTTTAGTPQDEDLRWQKTYKVGIQLLVDAINILKQVGVPVDVIVIPGNHDFERSFYMGEFLDAWFRNDTQVNINNSANPRKYYRYGEVLLGFTHGSEEKEMALPMIMASDKESKPMWSDTKFHEWHLGHVHRKKNITYGGADKNKTLTEDLGVTVRYLSSLTGTEEWHNKKGFIGNIKAADAFVWNDETGLIAHLNSNLKFE